MRANAASWSGERLAHCSEIVILVRSSSLTRILEVLPNVLGCLTKSLSGNEAEPVPCMASGIHEADCEVLARHARYGEHICPNRNGQAGIPAYIPSRLVCKNVASVLTTKVSALPS